MSAVAGVGAWEPGVLGTARMRLVFGEVDPGGERPQVSGQCGGGESSEDSPVFFGDRDHHAVVDWGDFQRQVIARHVLFHGVLTRHRAERRQQHRDQVPGQQRQAEGEDRRLG